MNKREQKNISTEAWHRVRMKRALRKLGCTFDDTETTTRHDINVRLCSKSEYDEE